MRRAVSNLEKFSVCLNAHLTLGQQSVSGSPLGCQPSAKLELDIRHVRLCLYQKMLPQSNTGPCEYVWVGPPPSKMMDEVLPTYGRFTQISTPLPIFICPVSVTTLGSPNAKMTVDAVHVASVSFRSKNLTGFAGADIASKQQLFRRPGQLCPHCQHRAQFHHRHFHPGEPHIRRSPCHRRTRSTQPS